MLRCFAQRNSLLIMSPGQLPQPALQQRHLALLVTQLCLHPRQLLAELLHGAAVLLLCPGVLVAVLLLLQTPMN